MSPFNNHHDEDEETGGSTGAAGSQVEFVDFMLPNKGQNSQQTPLSIEEQKRSLWQHGDLHKRNVEKQKDLRTDRENKKLRIGTQREYQLGASDNPYLPNPVLKDKPQFTGIDNQNSPVPLENKATTNDALRNDLRPSPSFTPKPNNTPRLIR